MATRTVEDSREREESPPRSGSHPTGADALDGPLSDRTVRDLVGPMSPPTLEHRGTPRPWWLPAAKVSFWHWVARVV
ncbi:MAG: hypothetical protein KDC38_17640, partial [Planctomycetes bacterium]|nr:hypothetical protein [Planctomycetota bacterium]